MEPKKFLFVLISLIARAHVIECVTCRFSGEMTYNCEINFQIIDSESDLMQIDGQHVNGRTNDNVESLETAETQIHMFPSLLIDQFINLKYVTLSDVKMKSISRPMRNCGSLRSLYMDRNELNNLPAGIFANCALLSSLNLDYNQLRTISASAFVGTSITYLHLTGNQIESFDPSTFAALPRLALFYFNYNKLTELPENAFVNNPELFSVSFEGNHLTTVPAKLLPNQTELRSISFSSNQITKIYAETFANSPKLEMLFFDQNMIEEIPEFINLPNLRWLSFMFNKVKAINGNSFKNLSSLSSLYLSYNEIETINMPANDPNYLPNLRSLMLTNNSITNITGSFDSLPVNLTSLNLDENKLTHLQAGSIHPMSQLRYLQFSRNEINKIDREFFEGAVNLTVNILRNPCVDSYFEISNGVNSTIAELLEKCYNSGQKARVAGFVLVASILSSIVFKFL